MQLRRKGLTVPESVFVLKLIAHTVNGKRVLQLETLASGLSLETDPRVLRSSQAGKAEGELPTLLLRPSSHPQA